MLIRFGTIKNIQFTMDSKEPKLVIDTANGLFEFWFEGGFECQEFINRIAAFKVIWDDYEAEKQTREHPDAGR